MISSFNLLLFASKPTFYSSGFFQVSLWHKVWHNLFRMGVSKRTGRVSPVGNTDYISPFSGCSSAPRFGQTILKVMLQWSFSMFPCRTRAEETQPNELLSWETVYRHTDLYFCFSTSIRNFTFSSPNLLANRQTDTLVMNCCSKSEFRGVLRRFCLQSEMGNVDKRLTTRMSG